MGYQRRMRTINKNENNNESYDDCAEAADKFVSRILPLSLMNYGSNNDENEYNSELSCSSMETMLLATIAELFGSIDQQWGGYVAAGGSESNLYALWAIRELAILQNCSLIVIASDYAHYSIGKVCNLLKLLFYSIPSNGNGEMNYDALREVLIHIQTDQSKNTFVCVVANIGATFSGAVDNTDHIRSIFDSVKLDPLKSFVHADAAHAGIINAFYPAHNTKLILGKTIDSISISGQKFFGCCFPCSIILHDLSRLPYPNGKLISYAGNRPDVTISGTRSGVAIAWLWSYISLKTIDGLKKDVEISMHRADQLVASLQSANIPHFRNSYSTTVVFPCPSKRLQDKYYLMALPEINLAQCCAMPHFTEEIIQKFVDELVLDLTASNLDFKNQQGIIV
jgi:histidine decarboxylase